MTERPRGTGTAARLALAAALAAAAGAARADSWSALVEPRFQWTEQRGTDQAGQLHEMETDLFGQQYVLTLSKSLFPSLVVNAGGDFQDDDAWVDVDGVRTHDVGWRGNGWARLVLGSPYLGASAGYNRADEVRGGTNGTTPRLVNEMLTATGYWHPADLPQLDVTASRTHTYDAARILEDTVIDDVTVATDYRGIPRLDLRYSLRWTNPMDRINRTTTQSVSQNAQATWHSTLFGGRTNAYANGAVTSLVSSTAASGPGGTVSTQQYPVRGLSLVESPTLSPPPTPDRDALVANPKLVDGDLTTGAGLDIGWGVPLGDTAYRDIGAEFQDLVTKVSRIWVWVNKPVPQDLATHWRWQVWTSKDDVTWTKLGVEAPATFDPFQNRFQIDFPTTSEQYVKVTVRPITTVDTTDPRWQQVLVTEIQFFLVVPAQSVAGRSANVGETVTLTTQTRLLSVPDLSWDASVLVAHRSSGPLTYSVTNGLGLQQRLDRVWTVSGRVQRQDLDAGAGHVGSFLWSATASARPLPTLSHSLTYAGGWSATPIGNALTNTVTTVNRAELYRGASVIASAGASDATSDRGVATRTVNGNATVSLVPDRKLTFSASYGASRIWVSGGGSPASTSTTQRIDASATLAPFDALYVSGSVSRFLSSPAPRTLASGTVALSPFAGGSLQLRLAYTQTLDTGADAVVSTFASGVHWTVRPGVLLDASYTLLQNRAAAERTRTATLLTMLTITL